MASDTLFVSAIPPVAYWLAYSFESGYVGYFGIPEFLISVSIERLFYFLSLLAIIYILLISFLDPIFECFPERLKSVRPVHYFYMFGFLLQVFFGGILLVLNGFKWLSFFWVCLGLIGIICTYVLPAMGKKSFDDYISELDKNYDSGSERRRKSLTFKLVNSELGNFYLIFIFILILLAPLAKFIGEQAASNQNSYLILSVDGTDYALIRTYGDDNILVSFRREWNNLYLSTPTFGKETLIRKSAEQSDVYYQVNVVRPD